MTNHLGEWFWGERQERGWGPGEVARRLGYTNVSKACNKLLRFERQGEVADDFLARLAALYEVPGGWVRYLAQSDRLAYLAAWERWADEPVPIRIVVRAVPGFMVELATPTNVTTPEQVVAFAQNYARLHRKKVFAVLSRRETVGITEAGEVDGRFHATPESDPCPGMSLGRVRFLVRLGRFD